MRPNQFAILATGFASGLPLLLTLSTLSFWLKKVGVDKTTIGLFALVGMPYTFKFLWSPLIDRLPLPILRRWLGRRRSWLFLSQLLLAAAIFALGQTDPSLNPWSTAMVALIVAFLSASQDIVVDAYRIELLQADEQGVGAGVTQTGYRMGMLLAGAGALALSDYLPWPLIFSILSGVMLLAAMLTLFLPEPAAPAEKETIGYAAWVKKAIIDPLGDFLSRRGWPVVLLFIMFYKLGDAFAVPMVGPFYVEMGFTGTEIAAITKIYGLIATLVGGVLGGAGVARYGLFPTLLVGGVLQALTNLLFSLLALQGHDLYWLGIAITADNLAGGFASVAFVAYLSRLCNTAYTATQYALLSSFMALGRAMFSSGSGWLSDHLPWAGFWAVTTVMAIPGLLLMLWIVRLHPQGGLTRDRSWV